MMLAYVEWVDAEAKGDEAWHNLGEMMKWAKEPLPIIRTCGLLIFANDSYIVIANSLGSLDVSQSMKIPRGWIKTFERLVTSGPAVVESFEYPVPEGE